MLTLLRQAFLLAGKDFRLFLRDRFGLAFALLFPLLFILGFWVAFGDVAQDDEADGLRFAVATEEAEGGVSRLLIGALAGAEDSPIVAWDADGARAAVEEGEIAGYVLFPADFTQGAFSGAGAALRVVVSGDDPEREAALRGFAWALAGRIETAALAAQAAVALDGPSALDAAALLAVAERPPLASLRSVSVGDVDPLNVADFTIPGYLTMFVFFVAALGAEAIARERQTQTLERLLANGARRGSIVTGKMLGGLYKGLLQLVILWVVGIFVFGMDFGHSPATVVLVSVMLAAASAAFGVMLAAMVKTAPSASSMAVLASLTLAPVGGCWWPLFVTPDWMQALAKVTPHGWANEAFNNLMLFGADPSDVLPHLAALAAFAVAFFAVALAKFRLMPAA